MKIEIEEEIIQILKKRMENQKEFNNIREYINNLLRQIVERIKKENLQVISKKDEEKVKEQLKNLGYLD